MPLQAMQNLSASSRICLGSRNHIYIYRYTYIYIYMASPFDNRTINSSHTQGHKCTQGRKNTYKEHTLRNKCNFFPEYLFIIATCYSKPGSGQCTTQVATQRTYVDNIVKKDQLVNPYFPHPFINQSGMQCDLDHSELT